MNRNGRVTLIELIALICIGIEMLYLIGNAFGWLDFHISSGNDRNTINTCESVAKVNSLNGMQCPVNDCDDASGECTHYFGGSYIGYFDAKTNTIVADAPKGYNDSKNPEVDEKTYMGEEGTMVLEVVVSQGTVQILWTGGVS